jgi:tetratricopeptide (TPR) repeat protein
VAEAKPSSSSPPPKGGKLAVTPAPTESAPSKPSFRTLWPIPALVIGAGLFVGGLVVVAGSRPKPDLSIPLKEAERLVESGQFQEAIERLNGPARGFIDSGKASGDERIRFLLARARAFAGAQQALAISVEFNHRAIIQDYAEVERAEVKLQPEDTVRLATSMIAVGEIDEALSRIGSLPPDYRAQRMRLTRNVIEHNLDARDRREEMTLDLLATLATDPDASSDDRSWVLLKQTELLLSLHRVEEAITKLLREVQRLRDVTPERTGELYVLLGKAYFEAGQPDNAEKQLDAAEGLLDRGSLLRADATLLLGQIAQNRGEHALEQAREKFTLVVTEFRSSPAYVPAVLGLAEVDAASREFDQSMERYAEVTELIRKGEAPREIDRERVNDSLLNRYRERYEDHDLPTALRFAQMAETLYPDAEVPSPVLSALARTNRDLADEEMEQARASHAADFSVKDLDPVTRAEVKRHYLAAGDYFRRHAEQIAAANMDSAAESLWIAADSFDRAGDLDAARKAFSAYVDGASETDPNRPAAKFRLAQIFQAEGDYPSATGIYEDLRATTATASQPQASGTWADRSIVPLALCYLADKDPDNDIRAETLLKSVIDGSLLSPDARDYREALIQLGNMYYSAGRYPDAIVRYEEVIERYADLPNAQAIRFKLADSHRLESQRILGTLASALPQSVEDELKATRAEHLRAAMKLYDQVRLQLEAADGARMPELDKTFLRNSYFYVGDCAYELGDYDRAVAAYDSAALKYADDPSSLVAMAQIVSAYVAEGQWAQARTANERARRQLSRFPDEVWSRPDLPMEKRHWERWLDARTVLERSEATVPTPTP